MTNAAVPTQGPITPHLVATNAAAAIAFYERAFGAEVIVRQDTPDKSKIVHAMLALNGGIVLVCDDFPELRGGVISAPQPDRPSSVTIHLILADVDAVWARAVAAGATVAMPLQNMFWGDRYGIVVDPAGHRWSLSTPQKAPTEDELQAGTQKYFPPKSGS